MAKDKFYFSHDSNARHDDKMIALRMKHGWEGYGLYWAIIEKLRESTDYTSVCDFNMIAYDLRSDAGKIKSIINDFGLFAFTENGECFYSNSLKYRMSLKEEKSQKARDSVMNRWQKVNEIKQTDTNVLPTKNDSNTSKVKERKVKEIKVKEIDISQPKVAIDFDGLLNFYNQTFKKSAKIVNDIVRKKYIAVLKQGYSKDDISNAMRNCAKNSFHIETNYQHCTLEFFSRANIIDKYREVAQVQQNENVIKSNLQKITIED